MNRFYSIIEFARQGRLDIIQEIIEDNPLHPIDERDKHGKTPFIYAAQNNHVNILEFLRGEGADINVVDTYGNNALGLAIGCGSFEAAHYLLTLGVSANSKFNGQPLIHIAILAENIDIIERLLVCDADPTVSNSQGFDGQQMAKRCLPSGKYDIFNGLLIEHGWI
jgi:ankyrin repeat protein